MRPSGALPREHAVKAVTVSGLTTQGYEVKAVIHDALILQKGAEVFWCILHLGKTAPLSYVSECYSVR